MGAADSAAIDYIRQNDIFADLFNYFIYGGRRGIDPKCLEELDTRELFVPEDGNKGKKKTVQRSRDVIKSVTAMTDRHTVYLALAVECQTDVHYAMPVRAMLYDALRYMKLVGQTAARHREERSQKGVSGAEYLSGFTREDRLIPIVTLVLYFDAKPWDGPVSLHEMFGEKSAEVLALVPDYRMNLVQPSAIPDEDFGKFRTTLKEVLSFIKYSNDKTRLNRLLEENPNFRRMGRKEVEVLNLCANGKLKVEEKKGETDVCLAIQQMIEEATQEEREKAKQEREKAKQEREKAIRREREKAKQEREKTIERMLASGKLSVEDISEYLGISCETVRSLAAK